MAFRTSKNRGRALILAATASVFALSACSTPKIKRGYIIDQELMSAIQPGVDNQDSVVSMLGTPSAVSTFNPRIWYYVSSVTTRKAFFNETRLEQDIVSINFDGEGYVDSVDRYDMADARKVNPKGGKTPTRGKTLGFFQQIFGNIGRFSGAPGGGGGGPGS